MADWVRTTIKVYLPCGHPVEQLLGEGDSGEPVLHITRSRCSRCLHKHIPLPASRT